MSASRTQISKVRKLLAHAKGTTRRGEAKSYRDLAKRLMALWDISKADLSQPEEARVVIGNHATMPLWQRVLADACAMSHRCRARVHRGSTVIVGDHTDVAPAVATFRYYLRKIQYVATHFFGPRWDQSWHGAFAYGYAALLLHKASLHRQGKPDVYRLIIEGSPDATEAIAQAREDLSARTRAPTTAPPQPDEPPQPSQAQAETDDDPDLPNKSTRDHHERETMDDQVIQAGGNAAATEIFTDCLKLENLRERATMATHERSASPRPAWVLQY